MTTDIESATTTATTNPPRSPTRTGITQVTGLLRDDRFDRATRLMRLQGWRGSELACAVRAGHAHRLAPGFCAVGSAVIAVTGSAWLAAALMATAVVGIFARNHPVETLYNAVAARSGRMPIPQNKAAKRLGCALGTAFLAASTVSIMVGADVLGRSLAASFAVVAGFVAFTNICVPSLIFTALWGADRATARRLI